MIYLKLQNIYAKYQNEFIIDNLNLNVEHGELLVLLGSSGCGKTTLLKIIAGLIHPEKGKIIIEEQDITDLTFEPLNLIDVDAVIDMTDITQQTIIRKLEKVDDITYREVKKWTWPDDNDDTTNEISGITLVGHNVDVKITMQSVIAEAANRIVLGRKAIYTY